MIESNEDNGVVYGYTPEYVRVAVNSKDVNTNSSELIYLEKINPEGFVIGNSTKN